MLLSPIDWAIILVYVVGCAVVGVWMKRYVRGVDDFTVAGREMDTNLGLASLAATELGLATVMYTAEMGFKSGFAGTVPGVLRALAMLLVGLSGFVIVPLRKARVITIPELFEERFGKRVRWLAGLVVVVGGVLNMGIFLRLGGEFLVYATGLNPDMLEWTMTALLVIVLLYTVLGGMVSVLVTDFIQFLVMGLGIVVTSALVIHNVGWNNLLDGLWQGHEATVAAAAAGQPGGKLAMANPFDPFGADGVGTAWVLWQAMLALSVMTTWQTTIARVLSAKNTQTAKRVYCRTAFYHVGRFVLPGLWGAAAFVYFSTHGGLPEAIDNLQAMPAYLNMVLPVGIIGIMVAAMLAAEMSTESSYLLTWATVIYNDLVMPCLRRPLSSGAKLAVVRSLVVLIGLFVMFYGLWYELPGRAWDYLAVTGSIYMASIFALLIGALYWRGANSWGAIASLILGAVGPIAFLIVNAVVEEESRKIAPELAGLSSFGLAFAGMLFGSLLGSALGHGHAGPTGSADFTEEVD